MQVIEGFGGQLRFESDGFGSTSTFNTGATTLTASGLNSAFGNFGLGGLIQIRNVQNGGIQPDLVIDSLTALSDGFGAGSIDFTADAALIKVTNNANLTAVGNITVFANDIGELAVGGDLTATANGNFFADHANRPDGGSTVSGQNISIIVGNNVFANPGSSIQARNQLYVQTLNGQLNAANLTAVTSIRAYSNQDLNIGDATTTGVPNTSSPFPVSPGLIDLQAGYTSGADRNIANATITGKITSTGDTLISAGGDVVLDGTANLASDNRILLASADDIIVNGGASLVSGLKPIPETGYGSTGLISLSAGSIPLNGGITDSVHSIIMGNATLTATNNLVSLSGEAIDAGSATFSGGQFSAIIDNAPATGVPLNNDNGQLSAGCEQGNICLGNVTATFDPNFNFTTGAINIGPVSGTIGLPNGVSLRNSQTGTDISIRARDTISLSGANLRADNNLLVASLNGDVLVAGAGLSGGLSGTGGLKVFAGGDITNGGAGAGSLYSGTDLGLFAGGALNVESATAQGVLHTIDSDGN